MFGGIDCPGHLANKLVEHFVSSLLTGARHAGKGDADEQVGLTRTLLFGQRVHCCKQTDPLLP